MGTFPTCSICLMTFEEFANIAACACGHTFHHDCIVGWAKNCQAEKQPSLCPTCKKRFETNAARGIVKKLYFNFDVASPDEEKSKQIEIFEAQAESRDAEIAALRRKLELTETLLKSCQDVKSSEMVKLENQLKSTEAMLLSAQEENVEMKRRADLLQGIVDLVAASGLTPAASADGEAGDAATREERAAAPKQRTSDAKRLKDSEVKIPTEALEREKPLNNHIDDLKKAMENHVDELLKAERKKEVEEVEGVKCNICEETKCQIFVWNIDFSVTAIALKRHFYRWPTTEVAVHYDERKRSLGTGHIVFGSSVDAREARKFFSGTFWFGRELKMRYATREEVDLPPPLSSTTEFPPLLSRKGTNILGPGWPELRAHSPLTTDESKTRESEVRSLIASNIKLSIRKTPKLSEVKEFFAECGDLKEVRLHRDARGFFTGTADVVFWDRKGAENALECNGFSPFDRPLKIENAHT